MTYRYGVIVVYGLEIPEAVRGYRHVGQTFHYCSEILFPPVDADYRILVTGHPSHLVCRLRKFFVVCDSYWYLLTRTTLMACSNFVFPPLPPFAPRSWEASLLYLSPISLFPVFHSSVYFLTSFFDISLFNSISDTSQETFHLQHHHHKKKMSRFETLCLHAG